ncbi:hypothetical protein ACO0QE_002226 [Hanseniaspora vineae]
MANLSATPTASTPAVSTRTSPQPEKKMPSEQEQLWDLINSKDFTLYKNIEYLIKYSNNIGIHFYLCQTLLSFPHYSLQFYIPQFVQILLTVETESLALEEALLKLSSENPHFALLTFWQLQALLGDLSNDPKSYGFEVARRNLNKLQNLLLDFSQTSDVSVFADSKGLELQNLETGSDHDIQNSMHAAVEITKMRENIHPSIVASSMVWASVGLPQAGVQIKPLVVSQGKREKSHVFTVAKNAFKKLNKNIQSLKTNESSSGKGAKTSSSNSFQKHHRKSTKHSKKNQQLDTKVILSDSITKEDLDFRKIRELSPTREILQKEKSFDIVDKIGDELYGQTMSSSIRIPKRRSQRFLTTVNSPVSRSPSMSPSQVGKDYVTLPNSPSEGHTKTTSKDKSWLHRVHQAGNEGFMNSMPELENDLSNASLSSPKATHAQSTDGEETNGVGFDDVNSIRSLGKSASRPDLKINTEHPQATASRSSALVGTPTFDPFDQHQERRSSLRHGANLFDIDPSKLSTAKKIKLLKMNYFRCETQFVIALESISQRLSRVPKAARLSMLRAELALLNRDLPAEVDIPTLLPSNKKGKLHKLVNIVCNEAQVLNSAEKVPYLLFIEYLRDDMDFDPTTEANEDLLQEKPQDGSFIFDLTNIKNKDYPVTQLTQAEKLNAFSPSVGSPASLFSKREVDLGDLSMVRVEKESTADAYRRKISMTWAEKAPLVTNNGQVLSGREHGEDLSTSSSTDQQMQLRGRHNSVSSFDDLATQMRISAVMLAQLESNSQTNVKIRESTEEIRATIIKSMQQVQDKFGFGDLETIENSAGERKLENDLLTGGLLMTKMDTSYLGEDWNTKRERIKRTSKYGHLDNWDLCSVIAKSGDDLRQEAFACQLIQAIANIWQDALLDIWVKKMRILITSPTTGLVETITNAVSIHSIKKSLTTKMLENGELNNTKGEIATLLDHFRYAYGDPNGYRYKRAQDCFASSLAAYSLICYLLQIKDRHNGNIMIDNEGHVVHIDFGFMFSNSPGSVGFEAAPFKLTFEYIDVLGGLQGAPFLKFCELVKNGFKALRKHASQLVSMCSIMQKESLQPCFNAGEQTSVQFEQRFMLSLSDEECDKYVEDYLIGKSIGSMYTRLYDQFQLITQGIYS